jgi:hypothetical protein
MLKDLTCNWTALLKQYIARMQSAHSEWQVALQRAQAIQPLGSSLHTGDNFSLAALLDADNRRRLELVGDRFPPYNDV